MTGSEVDSTVPATVTVLSLDTTSFSDEETPFKDESSVATLASTGALVPPHAFEYIVESAFFQVCA